MPPRIVTGDSDQLSHIDRFRRIVSEANSFTDLTRRLEVRLSTLPSDAPCERLLLPDERRVLCQRGHELVALCAWWLSIGRDQWTWREAEDLAASLSQ